MATDRALTPWRLVVGFGVVSLAADMVYEGARAVYGPLLASVGASAVVVGLVAGAGEAMALLLRLVSGPFADRSGRYWALTIGGYALTAVCVPLLAFGPVLGLAFVSALILAERFGKAVRSPAKSALLADAAGRVGMGRGIGVHKALDEVGALTGPLLVAAVVALAGGVLWPGLAVLAVPGVVAMVVLVVLWRRSAPAAPRPVVSDPRERRPLPPLFWRFAVAVGVCTVGLVTFGLVGFHLADAGVVPTAGVPVLYAVAMAAAGVAALATGVAYDRSGPRVLLALPPLVAVVPALVFTGGLWAAVVGVLVWGVAGGVQDSTVKAFVADLVPRDRRATAYGVFAAVQGAGALIGGVVAGVLYERSRTSLVLGVAAVQVVALVMLVAVVRSAAETRR